jgi:uncharacterized membrane protein required for colicin V production
MNMLDAILIGAVVCFSIVGLAKGLLWKALEVLCFVISIAAAYAYYKNAGGILGITLAFFLPYLVLAVLLRMLRNIWRKNEAEPTFVSRLGGGVIGGFEGIIFAAAVVAFLHLLNGFFAGTNSVIAKGLQSSFCYSRYKAISMASRAQLVKDAYVIGELLKGKAGELVLDPEAVSQLQKNLSIEAVLSDEKLLDSIKQRDYAKVVSNPKIIKILNDAKLVRQLAAIALKAKSAPVIEGQRFQRKATQAKSTGGNRLEGIMWSERMATVIIGGQIYQKGSEACGGKIVEISLSKMTMEFADKQKTYSVGEEVP